MTVQMTGNDWMRTKDMPLGPDVRYLSDTIKEEQKVVDDMFWGAMTPEDFIRACRREIVLQCLEDLYEQGEVYDMSF